MGFTREDLADACRRWGTKMPELPADISGPMLMWALAGCESSFGLNCAPRHEAAYCTGIYSHNQRVIELTREYGHDAHCSFGPWQILLVNCQAFTKPEDLASLNRCALETVQFINVRILKAQGARTVEQIADAYNSGTWRDANTPAKYIADCMNFYTHAAMPIEKAAGGQ